MSGRRSKLTREILEACAKFVESGVSLWSVGESLGVYPATLYRWQSQGKKTH